MSPPPCFKTHRRREGQEKLNRGRRNNRQARYERWKPFWCSHCLRLYYSNNNYLKKGRRWFDEIYFCIWSGLTSCCMEAKWRQREHKLYWGLVRRPEITLHVFHGAPLLCLRKGMIIICLLHHWWCVVLTWPQIHFGKIHTYDGLLSRQAAMLSNVPQKGGGTGHDLPASMKNVNPWV